MKRIYELPSIEVTMFDAENIHTELSTNYNVNTSLYGMQDFTTIQKVTHVLEEGSPEVAEILKYHVN